MKVVILTYRFLYFLAGSVFFLGQIYGQNNLPESYNITWTSQSENSSESMPCGGGDVGLNVWVEKGELLFYFSRSGTFDENNEFLKLGRVRVILSPNPLDGDNFVQQLNLKDGYITVSGKKNGMSARIKVWADVFHPVIYIDIKSNTALEAQAFYESWRIKDMPFRSSESFANSYKWASIEEVKKSKDSVSFDNNEIVFFHLNKEKTVFDITIGQ